MHLPGRTAFVSARQIGDGADVSSRPYTLRAGGRSEQDEHAGLSVRKLVQLAKGDPDGVSFLAVRRADGTEAVLRRGDLADPPPFPDGPPLVWVDSGSTHFFRPVRDGADVNANDNIATPSGSDAPLVLSAHTGALLDVAARATPVTVPVGQPVSFAATVQGAEPGEQLSYAWDLGGGTAAHEPSPTHTYAREGRYQVVLSVSGDHDSGGSSNVLIVQVGPRAPAKGVGPSGGTNPRPDAPAGGPARGDPKGTGRAGRRKSGRGGPGPGVGAPTTGSHRPAGRAPGAGSSSRIAPVAAGTTAAHIPSPARAGPVTPIASTPPATGRPAARRPPPAPARRTLHSPTPAVSGSAPVSGLLLASATPLAPGALPGSPPPAGAPVAAARGGEKAALPLGALAVTALLALGAASEWRGRIRRPRRSA